MVHSRGCRRAASMKSENSARLLESRGQLAAHGSGPRVELRLPSHGRGGSGRKSTMVARRVRAGRRSRHKRGYSIVGISSRRKQSPDLVRFIALFSPISLFGEDVPKF